MDDRILKWLYDIKISIEEIDSFFETEPNDFFLYKKNIMLKRAVERNLEVLVKPQIELLLETQILQLK